MRQIFSSYKPIGAAARLSSAVAIVFAGLSLSGCIGVALVAGTGAGMMVAQERSVGDGIDDMAMDFEIKSRLSKEAPGRLGRVNVNVSEGRVLLTGLVDTPDDRVAAARASWSHPRVKEVMNDIEIDQTSQWKRVPKDTWITTKLRTKLIFDLQVRSLNYEIEVVNGTIYLLGIAEDQIELERVTGHASSLAGVVKVVSHVHLKDGRERRAMIVGRR